MAANRTSQPARPHRWSKFYSRWLSFTVAAFGGWAWLEHFNIIHRDTAQMAGGLLMAILCVGCQGMSNAYAVEAMDATDNELDGQALFAVLISIGCAAMSAFSMWHGWEVVKSFFTEAGIAPPDEWIMTGIFCFIAFAEPSSFWIRAANKNAWHTKDEDKKAEQQASRERQGWRPQVVEQAPQQPAWRDAIDRVGHAMQDVGRGAARTIIGGAAILGANQISAAAEPAPSVLVGDAQPGAGPVDHSVSERVKTMAIDGMSERRIVLALGRGLTRHEVREILGRNAPRVRDHSTG